MIITLKTFLESSSRLSKGVQMDKISCRSVNSEFTDQYFSICFACAKVHFKDLLPGQITSLCNHHARLHQQWLFKKYAAAEKEYLALTERASIRKLASIKKK